MPRPAALAKRLAAIKQTPIAPAYLVAPVTGGDAGQIPADYEAQLARMMAEADQATAVRLALLAVRPAGAPRRVVLL